MLKSITARTKKGFENFVCTAVASFDFDNDRLFEFEFPNIVASEPIALKVYTAAVGENPTTMQLKVKVHRLREESGN